MPKHLPLTLLALVLLACAGLRPAQAQTDPPAPKVVVVHTAPQATEDGLELSVYFAIRSPDGRLVPKGSAQIGQLGTLQLLTGVPASVPAQISDPQTPIKIALLLDASGSMQRTIADVREAAKQALESAPPNAEFAVFKFTRLAEDQPLSPLQELTGNRDLLRQAIDTVDSEPEGPTCLYNAAYQAVEYLRVKVGNPQERRAVILFTDGKDTDGTDNPCSKRSLSNVITNAKVNQTPLYTIGLCTKTNCENVEKQVLSEMFLSTGAFGDTGQRAQLGQLFKDIMDALNSQWVARARLYPPAGLNEALLKVPLGSGQPVSSAVFTFSSPKDFSSPPSIQLAPQYDPERDIYTLNFAGSSTAGVSQVTVEVWGESGQVDVQTYAAQDLAQPVQLATGKLEAGGKYELRVRATNQNGQPVRRSAEGQRGDDDPTLLSVLPITYSPKLRFDIVSATPNYDRQVLLIKLDIRGEGQRKLAFDGAIVSDQGQKLADIVGSAPDRDDTLTINLNRDLLRAAGQTKLNLALTVQGDEQGEPAALGFVLPPRPGVPWLTYSLGGLLALALIAFVAVLARRLRRPRPPPEPLWQSNRTGMIGGDVAALPTPQGGPRLTISVVRTVDAAQRREEQASVPCVIGRGQADFIIKGDPNISRRHLKIDFDGRQLLIINLSGNSTSMDGKPLEQGKPTPLYLSEHTPVSLRLGPNTEIELRPRRS